MRVLIDTDTQFTTSSQRASRVKARDFVPRHGIHLSVDLGNVTRRRRKGVGHACNDSPSWSSVLQRKQFLSISRPDLPMWWTNARLDMTSLKGLQ